MMLGIQTVMLNNKAQLFWDISQLSLNDIEDFVGKFI